MGWLSSPLVKLLALGLAAALMFLPSMPLFGRRRQARVEESNVSSDDVSEALPRYATTRTSEKSVSPAEAAPQAKNGQAAPDYVPGCTARPQPQRPVPAQWRGQAD